MPNAAAALPAQEGAAPARSKSKLILIIAAVLVLLAAAGGGAAWFFHQKAASAEASGAEDVEVKRVTKKGARKPPAFMTLDNFTVNLAGGDHFMQLGLVLQLEDEETAEHVKSYLPMIRNKVLLLLSSKTQEDLESPKGKQALIAEILAAAREPLRLEGESVQAVLLSSMLVQ